MFSTENIENGFTFTIDTTTGSGATKVSVYGPSGEADGMAGLDDLDLIAGQSNRLSLNTPFLSLKDSFANHWSLMKVAMLSLVLMVK